MIKAIINARIYDFESYIEKGFVLFEEKILKVGPMEAFIDREYEIINGSGYLVMPGLVTGHTHIYSAFARGMSVPFNPLNFQDILDQLWWKLDRHIDLETTYYSGIVSAVDHVKNGITTMIDHHASGIDIKGSLEALKKAVCDDVHLRGIFAFETSDRFDVDQAIEENVCFNRDYSSPFTKGLFGLHASMSLSEATLKKVKASLNDIPIHIHVAESVMDEKDCQNQYQEKIINRLNRHGLLNQNSIIAHAIHVDDDELKIIKKNKCVIAVNFSSNMNNSVGIPPLKSFRDHKIRVIVGNDGISSAMTTEYLSLYYATHLHDQTPNLFGLDELRKLINDTYEYASQILEINLGKIKKGFEADLLMVPYLPPTPMTQENALGHLFFGLFHSFKPEHVFVAGHQVVNHYEVNKDLITKYQEAIKCSTKLWNRIKMEDQS